MRIRRGGKNADESNLFDQALDVGGIDAIEVAFFKAARIKAVLEGIEVTGRGTARSLGGRGHGILSLEGCKV
jgi:hypothetical protein